jgi:hypothetical protein
MVALNHRLCLVREQLRGPGRAGLRHNTFTQFPHPAYTGAGADGMMMRRLTTGQPHGDRFAHLAMARARGNTTVT